MTIATVVLAKNEERRIKKCLTSLSLCDQVLVIDDYSIDHTTTIAKSLDAKVIQHKLGGDFSSQRNFAFETVTTDWILFVDADEIVSPELSEEILGAINTKDKDIVGYSLRRRDYFLGKPIVFSKDANQTLVRLVKKGKGEWKRRVHEVLVINGSTKVLEGELIHNSHPSMAEFVESTNYYSDLHAVENKNGGKGVNLGVVIFFPIVKFIKSWVLGQGFRDTERGIIYALMGAFHSFLSWSKQWLNQRDSH